jgi:phage gp36-like protein
MSYCSYDDIRGIVPDEVLIQLTDDANIGEVDTAKVTDAIDNAGSAVDGYAAGRYAVPFAPVPRLIMVTTLDIAIYNLFSRRENVPENRKDRYKNAIKTCEALADGKLTIGEAEAPPVEASGVIKVASRPKQFDEDTLDRY